MGPPPDAAEGSSHSLDRSTQSRHLNSRVTVKDVPEDKYEGKIHKTEEEARWAVLEEEDNQRCRCRSGCV
jgi:hypothetical protein